MLLAIETNCFFTDSEEVSAEKYKLFVLGFHGVTSDPFSGEQSPNAIHGAMEC